MTDKIEAAEKEADAFVEEWKRRRRETFRGYTAEGVNALRIGFIAGFEKCHASRDAEIAAKDAEIATLLDAAREVILLNTTRKETGDGKIVYLIDEETIYETDEYYQAIHAAREALATFKRQLLSERSCGLPIRWPEATHGNGRKPLHTAAECIDWSLPCPSIFDRKRPLAPKTERRIALGMKRYVLDAAEAGGAFLVNTRNGERVGQAPRVRSLTEPFTTVTAEGSQGALVVPFVAKVNHGRDANRSAAIDSPMSTVTASRRGHALVSAFVVKHFGGVVGHDMGRVIGTITSKDHHSVAAAHLVQLRGDPSDHQLQPDLSHPCRTISAGGNHAALVYAFLVKFFGTAIGQPCADPLCTVTTKDRCGLVTVTIDGDTYVVVDIGFRMLEPHELLCAQFGRFAKSYKLFAARTKSAKVRLIGNSVCPEVAEALVRANVVESKNEAVA